MISGKKIIIAGIAGRVGAGIGEHFLKNNNEVWGYDLFYTPGSKEYWESKGVHTIVGDFTKGEYDGLPTDADYCINLAANTTPANFSIGMKDNALGPTLLMRHCKNVKAFLNFSSASVYTTPDEPMTPVTEEDLVGAKTLGFYPGSKIAGEGAVTAMAHVLQLPTIQVRLTTYYGTHGDGGLFVVNYLNCLVSNLPIDIVKDRPTYLCGMYEKDISNFIEPLLKAASPEAPVVNLTGDDYMSVEDLVAYMGELTGIKPVFQYADDLPWPSMIVSPEKRKSITGPSEYPWKKGIRELVDFWLPKLQSEQPKAVPASEIVGAVKYTRDTRIKEIINLPDIVDFLSKHSGQKIAPFTLKMGSNMTLQKAGGYLKWTDEQIQEVVNELNTKYQ